MNAKWIFSILGLMFGFHLHAQSSLSATSPDQQDLDHIEIYLHTVNVGDLVYNNFGHTAIRIKDRRKGTDMVYNWGIFDFGDPLNFSLRFYQGDLIYKLGVYPYRFAVPAYQRERRQVWEDRLNFPPQEKQIFLDKLAWNARPENRDYAYQYFFDNCSTRPRDYLDLAVGGALQRQSEKSSGKTFRQMVREGYQYNPFMDLLLEIGMNGRIDRDMSRWEGMFHPLLLREEILKLQVENRPLVDQSRVLVSFPGPTGNQHIFKILAAILMVPISVCIFLLQRVAWQRYHGKAVSLTMERFGLRLLGGLGFMLLLFFGFCGIMMPLNWIFSGHTDLHHNLNMIFFLPTDIVLVSLAGTLLLRGRALPCSSKRRKLAKRYVILHIGLLTAGALSWSMGDSIQAVGRVIYLAVPYVLVIALMVNFGLAEESASNDHLDATNRSS